jgi:peptidoglycan/LPS O-acetylase OafA/YrhL
MKRLAREVLVTVAAGLCLAGPIAAIVVPLSPADWRSPQLVWGILLGALALVAGLRRNRWTRR